MKQILPMVIQTRLILYPRAEFPREGSQVTQAIRTILSCQKRPTYCWGNNDRSNRRDKAKFSVSAKRTGLPQIRHLTMLYMS